MPQTHIHEVQPKDIETELAKEQTPKEIALAAMNVFCAALRVLKVKGVDGMQAHWREVIETAEE